MVAFLIFLPTIMLAVGALFAGLIGWWMLKKNFGIWCIYPFGAVVICGALAAEEARGARDTMLELYNTQQVESSAQQSDGDD